MRDAYTSMAHSVKRRPFVSKGGWIVKFNDAEVERCYKISFDYDMWEYTVNNQVTKKFPASGISTIKIEIGED